MSLFQALFAALGLFGIYYAYIFYKGMKVASAAVFETGSSISPMPTATA